jgi:hypothetical protein
MAWCRTRTVVRAAGLAGLVGLGVFAWLLWPTRMPPPAWAADYDLTARHPESLPPGTVVGGEPPAGWSHLVIKSRPRVRESEVPKVPKNALIGRDGSVRMAGWMIPVFAADVRPETRGMETRHRLRAVAQGMCVAVGGRDVVVTPETAKDHGVGLDWITGTILKKGYETQRMSVIVVHGPTFGLVDCPVWFRCGDTNRLVRFRYALLVDAPTGKLDVLVWLLDPDAECGDATTAELLAPNLVDAPELVPDPKEFNSLGIPSDAAFGVDQLPAGRVRVSLPPGLRDLSAKTRFTAGEARTLEAGLRDLLPSP